MYGLKNIFFKALNSKFPNMNQNIRSKRLLLSFLILLFIIPINLIYAEDKSEIGVDLGFFSGGSLLEAYGNSWNKKVKPLIGVSIIPYVSGDFLNYIIELSYGFEFRSNYDNYYYYTSIHSLKLIPKLGTAILFKRFGLTIDCGLGVNFLFSQFENEQYLIISSSAGVKLYNFLIKSINICYVHNFSDEFKLYETLKLYVTTNLYTKKD